MRRAEAYPSELEEKINTVCRKTSMKNVRILPFPFLLFPIRVIRVIRGKNPCIDSNDHFGDGVGSVFFSGTTVACQLTACHLPFRFKNVPVFK